MSWLKLEIGLVSTIIWMYNFPSPNFIHKGVNEREVFHCIGSIRKKQNKHFFFRAYVT